MATLDRAPAITRAISALAGDIAASAAMSPASTITSAIAPNEPTRGSRITSSRRSSDPAPNRPSAASARPSRWRPPVRAASTATAVTAPTRPPATEVMAIDAMPADRPAGAEEGALARPSPHQIQNPERQPVDQKKVIAGRGGARRRQVDRRFNGAPGGGAIPPVPANASLHLIVPRLGCRDHGHVQARLLRKALSQRRLAAARAADQEREH